MTMSVGKRTGIFALVLVLLLGLLPFSAAAAKPCPDGTHTPGSTLYPADWNAQTGGYGCDYYRCTVCDSPCDIFGYSPMHVGPQNGCSGGIKRHLPGSVYVSPCAGSYTGTLYSCSGCGQIVDADGTLLHYSSAVLTGHTPGTNLFSADFQPCTGGYQSGYFLCDVCGFATDAGGNSVPYSPPTAPHTPGSTLYPADWNDQTGGYGWDYYKCTVCGAACDENGHPHVFVGADNGCSGGYKRHLPGTVEYPPDYTPCSGGFKVSHYFCSACGRAVDAAGTLLFPSEGVHIPGGEQHGANYTSCGGGFKAPFYECVNCGHPVNADGSEAVYYEGTGVHIPGGEQHGANYTSCMGGYKAPFYECVDCGQPVNADGSHAVYYEGTGVHIPGGEQHEANYTSCMGGFKVPFYECVDCGQPVNADGSHAVYYDGTGSHTLEEIPAADPTGNEDGVRQHWHCTVCGSRFWDPDGTDYVENEADLILPGQGGDSPAEELRTDVSFGLAEVPESVADLYPTAEAVYGALVDAAVGANPSLREDEVQSVLLDVTLMILNGDGNWSPVGPDDFPEEGVEVLLPYPDGTGRSGFSFTVTHMITVGDRAGEIEVLPKTLTEDGILVRFTSLSPVVIAYQANTPDNPGGTGRPVEDSTVGKRPSGPSLTKPVGDPNPPTGVFGGNALLPVLLAAAAGLVLPAGKRRAR